MLATWKYPGKQINNMHDSQKKPFWDSHLWENNAALMPTNPPPPQQLGSVPFTHREDMHIPSLYWGWGGFPLHYACVWDCVFSGGCYHMCVWVHTYATPCFSFLLCGSDVIFLSCGLWVLAQFALLFVCPRHGGLATNELSPLRRPIHPCNLGASNLHSILVSRSLFPVELWAMNIYPHAVFPVT